MKKTIAMILCLVLCIGLLAACGGEEETTNTNNNASGEFELVNTGNSATEGSAAATPPPADAEYVDDLSMFIGDKVALVDPLNPGAQTSQAGIIFHQMFDTLVYCTIDNVYQPCLATEWTQDPDGTHYNFKLRDDVTFTNGEHFTADDVKFTMEASHEATGAGIYVSFNQVQDVEVVNDYEINVTLKAPNYDFIYDCASANAPILNREAYESGAENPGWVGTGAFKLVRMVPNDSLYFEKNEEYWGEPALCKTFSMRYIAEETARNIMLENGEFTFSNLSGLYVPEFTEKGFQVNSYVMNNCNYIAFNMKKAITGDKNFRLAVAYAIDRQAAVDIALSGFGKVCDCGSFWGNNSAYKNRDIPLIEQDLEKAKACLAESCYNGEVIELWAGMAQTIKAAQVYQEQLKLVGINAKVHECDGPSMTAATTYETNTCDMVIGSGSWTPLASSCKSFLTPGNNSNKAVYENDEVVELITKAAATPDGDDRRDMYYRIQEIVTEDMPYLGTFHMALYIGSQKGAGGNILFATNYHDYSHAYQLKNAE